MEKVLNITVHFNEFHFKKTKQEIFILKSYG